MSVQLKDLHGRFVRLIHDEDAAELVSRGLATEGGKGKKRFVQLRAHSLDDFDGPLDAGAGSGVSRAHYLERFETVAPISMLKRINERGQFIPWASNLTFDDLRGSGVTSALRDARRKHGARSVDQLDVAA